MTPKLVIHCVVMVVGFAAITIMYWLAADPPSVWIFAITSAGLLFGIGTTIARHRAGHFK